MGETPTIKPLAVHENESPSPQSAMNYPTPTASPRPLVSPVPYSSQNVRTERQFIESCGEYPEFRLRQRPRGAPLPPQVVGEPMAVMHPRLRRCPLGFTRLSQPWEEIEERWNSTLREVATNPLLPSLALTSSLLPWPIVVMRSGDRAYVTVGDVLRAMWEYFRIPMGNEIALGSGALIGIGRQQLEGASGLDRVQRQGRRVDLLLGRTCFVGVSRANGDADTWVMHVA